MGKQQIGGIMLTVKMRTVKTVHVVSLTMKAILTTLTLLAQMELAPVTSSLL